MMTLIRVVVTVVLYVKKRLLDLLTSDNHTENVQIIGLPILQQGL